MAALAANTNCSFVGNPCIVKLTANAADTYYKGAIVYVDTGGGAQVTYAAGDRPVGISTKEQTVSAGDSVEVMVDGFAWLPIGTNIAAADEGELLVNDANGAGGNTDNPADMEAAGDITPAANDACVGVIKKVETARMLVHIGPRTGDLYVATAGWGG